MVRVICKCGYRGSLQADEYKGKKYWRVFHADKDDCYLGEGPHELEVIQNDRAPIGTEKIVFDNSTELSEV